MPFCIKFEKHLLKEFFLAVIKIPVSTLLKRILLLLKSLINSFKNSTIFIDVVFSCTWLSEKILAPASACPPTLFEWISSTFLFFQFHLLLLGGRAEKTRLLPLFPIDVETMSMLNGNMVVRCLAPDPPIFARLTAIFGEGLGALVVNANQHVAQGHLEGLSQNGQRLMHARRVALQNQDAIVEVGNQSRQSVSFGVDQTTGVLLVRLKQRQVPSDGNGIGDPLMPPGLVRTYFKSRSK